MMPTLAFKLDHHADVRRTLLLQGVARTSTCRSYLHEARHSRSPPLSPVDSSACCDMSHETTSLAYFRHGQLGRRIPQPYTVARNSADVLASAKSAERVRSNPLCRDVWWRCRPIHLSQKNFRGEMTSSYAAENRSLPSQNRQA